LGGHWPDVNDACDPSLIEWKNLGVSQFSRFLRQVIIYLLCLAIMALGFTGIVYAAQEADKNSNSLVTEATCGTAIIK
jgi:hypothetical protein